MRVAVDIGGTFTDVVVFDEAKSSLALAKALSTPAELARGVEEGLNKAAVPLDQVLSLIHGSTIVVNAIIERQGGKTALITTKGFRDVYEIGRINRPESFNPRFRKHRPSGAAGEYLRGDRADARRRLRAHAVRRAGGARGGAHHKGRGL